MKFQRHSLRFLALAVVISVPLLGMSGLASAKATKGCHKTHTCKSGGGSGTGETGGTNALITVQIDPNPVVETGQSSFYAVIQVETSPSFAGDPVDISSSQLLSACNGDAGFSGFDVAAGPTATVTLDDDGNATVVFDGEDCAPGPSVVEADLAVAPYYTALATLDALPPVVTTPGLTGYPQTSGTVSGGEVETGDTSFTLDGSYVYGVFYVETNPVYAEQPVEISSPELQARCGTFSVFSAFTATPVLDDDGNAVFLFEGASCAAGPSTVIADVEAGTHPTYVTTFNVLPPQPTI
jgi:hypothetical protein